MAELGCAQDYALAFHDRTGSIPVGAALEPTSLSWGRVLDDTSDAQAVVDLASVDCCDTLSQIRTWCNDMSLYRDGALVWQGPVTEIEYVGDTVTINAKDVTAWLARRVVHTAMDFTAAGTGPLDLSLIAEALVRDAFLLDDPGVLTYLLVTLSGIPGERAYEVNQGYVGDELRELARTGIDFTAIGHRILLTGEGSLARLATLDDEHFAGPLRIVEDGLAATSRAIVLGEGIVAESGGIGPCGLLERLIKEDSIKDMVSAQAEADSLVASGQPTPLYLEVPDGSQLTPDAPVGIAELVPGVTIPVASTQTCRDVSAVLRLTKLAVTYGAGGESVAVTLSAPNAGGDA